MFTKLKVAALSALIGLGAVASVPATAQAGTLQLSYTNGNAAIGMQAQQVNHRYGHRKPRDRFQSCTPRRAVDKAERHGLRRARVADVSRRTITVSGRKWDRRVHMTFSRAPGCPVLRR